MLTNTPPAERQLWFMILALLIVTIAISTKADDLAIWPDEIFSINQAQGTLEQILRDPDVNAPPGHYILLHVWGRLASFNDFSLHWYGSLLGLVATALLIRVGQELLNPAAGWLTGVLFGTSSYMIYFFLEQRPYSLMFVGTAAFILCYVRWLKRDSRQRRTWLVLAAGLMLYSHFILWFILLATTAHVLLLKPRKLLGWAALVLMSFLLVSPIIPQFIRSFRVRGLLSGGLPGYFLLPLETQYRAFSIHQDAVFAIFVAVALIGIGTVLLRRQITWQTILWLGAWGVVLPILAYLLRERLTLWTTRYISFTAIPVYVLLGVGLAGIRWRSVRLAVAVGLVAFALLVPWRPFDHRPAESSGFPPLHLFTRYLAAHLELGDVVIIDPGCACEGDRMTWHYYENLYLPLRKLPRGDMDKVEQYRRIWYVVKQGSETAELGARIQQGRLDRGFWGPWFFAMTLWEAPPDAEGVAFGDTGIRFHGADIDRKPEIYSGDNIPVTLWWSADAPLQDEYSFSLQVRDAQGAVVTQVDGVPMPLTEWQPNALVLDQRQLILPYRLTSETMTLHLVVYRWQDNVRIEPLDDLPGGLADSILLDTMPFLTFNVG